MWRVLLVFILVGCGGRQGSEPSAQGVRSWGPNLVLRVSPAMENDATHPDIGQTLYESDRLISGNQIHFKEVLLVEDNRPLFLTWRPEMGETQMLDAHYIYVRMDARNQEYGSSKRRPAYYDEDKGVFFIPIPQGVAKQGYELDPQDLHLLTLDFETASGERGLVTVRFRARGGLPQIGPLGLSPPQLTAAARFAFAEAGWEVRRDRFQNPASRPVVLWVRPHGNLKLQYFLWEPGYRFPHLAKPIRQDRLRQVTTPVGIGRVRIKRYLGGYVQNEELEVTGDQELRLSLQPFEALEVVWLAQLPSRKRWRLPAPVHRILKWRERIMIRGTGGPTGSIIGAAGRIVGPRVVAREQSVTDSWRFAGLRLTGKWQIGMAITDLRGDQRAERVLSSPVDLKWGVTAPLALPLERKGGLQR